MSTTLPSISQLKSEAKRLRAELCESDINISHGRALELVAHQHGFRDWNTLQSKCSKRRSIASISLGEKVTGTYLGHKFSAVVIGLKSVGQNHSVRVTVQFDQAIDVVRSNQFSNFRRRVTCILNQDARTVEVTSDGIPHMQLELT